MARYDGTRGPTHMVEWLAAMFALTWVGGYCLSWSAAAWAGAGPRGSLLGFAVNAIDGLVSGSPVQPWRWVEVGTDPDPLRFYSAATGIVAAVGLLVALAIHLRPRVGGRRPHPVGRWARASDLRPLLGGPTAGRLVIGRWRGRPVRAEARASTLVFGPTQSGKSTGFCIPAVLSWDGPIVVTSTKRELVDTTGGHRQSVGPVHVYDPTASTGLPCSRWTPLAGCEHRQVALRRAAAMASALSRGNAQGGSIDWKHWEAGTRKLLGTLLWVAAVSGEDINAVRRWVDAGNADGQVEDALQAAMEKGVAGTADCAEAASALAAIETRPDVERQTVYSTTQQLLDVFLEESVARSAEACDIDIDGVLDERGTIYLCAPVEDQRRVASLFSGLVMAVVDRAYQRAQASPSGRLDPPLLLVLDEAANIAPLDDLPQMASQGVSQGVSLVTIFQDLAQVEERYGEVKARTIVNNHRAKIALRGISDVATCEYISRLVGSEMAPEVTYQGRGPRSVSRRPRPMAPAEVVRTVPAGQGLVVYGHLPPFYVQQRGWWTYPGLRRRAAVAFRREPGSAPPATPGLPASAA